MYREDCFANTENGCSALKDKLCHGCRFYRNDLKREDIEKDIDKYQLCKGVNKHD